MARPADPGAALSPGSAGRLSRLLRAFRDAYGAAPHLADGRPGASGARRLLDTGDLLGRSRRRRRVRPTSRTSNRHFARIKRLPPDALPARGAERT